MNARNVRWLGVLSMAIACNGDGSAGGSTEGGSSSSGSSAETESTSESSGSASGSESASSSGGRELDLPPAVCGDGVVEGAEACDDRNDDDFDHCRSDCAVGVEVGPTISYDGPDSRGDFFEGVVIGADDSIIVVGTERGGGRARLIVQQYLADGSAGWSYAHAGDGDHDSSGGEIAWTPEGDLVVAGVNYLNGVDTEGLVAKLGPDGSERWVRTFLGPGADTNTSGGFNFVDDVAVDATGQIVFVGGGEVDEQDFDIWVVALDPDGTVRWDDTYNNPSANDFEGARAVAFDGDAAIVVGDEVYADGSVHGWVRKYDPDGGIVWTKSLLWSPQAMAIASGDIVIAGDQSGRTVVSKFDAELTLLWEFRSTDASSRGDYAEAVAIDPAGNVLVGGYALVFNEQANALVFSLDVDGQPRWATTYNDELDLNDYVYGVAVGSGGRTIAVGSEVVRNQDSNGWIGTFETLTAP